MAAQVQTQERNDAGAKVTVASKHPAGIVMRRYVERNEREAVMGGGTRDFPIYRWDGEEVTIFGNAVPFGAVPKCQIVGGYALTPNVSKDLWDNWYQANKDTPLVKKQIIFAYESISKVEGHARECKDILSGFEGIDPANPGAKVKGIAKADVR